MAATSVWSSGRCSAASAPRSRSCTSQLRSERWKYVHRYPYGPHELFDLKEDPGERRNLYGEKRYGKRIAELKGELDSWFHRYVDPAVDGSHEGVTGKGQLSLAGPAGGGQKVWADDWHYLGRK